MDGYSKLRSAENRFDETRQGAVVKVDYEAKDEDLQIQTVEMVEENLPACR